MKSKSLARAVREDEGRKGSTSTAEEAFAAPAKSPFETVEDDVFRSPDREADAFTTSTAASALELLPAGMGVAAKLEVSDPGDELERDADRVAEEVTGSADERPVELRRSAASPSTGESSPAAASAVGALQSGGSPLPDSSRSFFEPRLGVDLGGVRVHAGPEAAAAAKSIKAQAFTYGQDIAFGEGKWSPDTPSGRKLLAHELAHVGQQDARNLIKRVGVDVEEKEIGYQEWLDDRKKEALTTTIKPEWADDLSLWEILSIVDFLIKESAGLATLQEVAQTSSSTLLAVAVARVASQEVPVEDCKPYLNIILLLPPSQRKLISREFVQLVGKAGIVSLCQIQNGPQLLGLLFSELSRFPVTEGELSAAGRAFQWIPESQTAAITLEPVDIEILTFTTGKMDHAGRLIGASGHTALCVGDTVYSYEEWWKERKKEDYLEENSYRNGIGLVISLTGEQVKAITAEVESRVIRSRSEYYPLKLSEFYLIMSGRTCASYVADIVGPSLGLPEVTAPRIVSSSDKMKEVLKVSARFSPQELLIMLLRSGKVVDTRFYPAAQQTTTVPESRTSGTIQVGQAQLQLDTFAWLGPM